MTGAISTRAVAELLGRLRSSHRGMVSKWCNSTVIQTVHDGPWWITLTPEKDP